MNPIDEKLEKLYKWKKDMIKRLFNFGIFLPYNAQLRDIFESLNVCATYRFWNGQNAVGVNYSKPMISSSNPYYLFMYSDDAIWKSKFAYEQLPSYPYNGDLITKLDTIFRWKSTVAQKMREGNCPLTQFTEDSSLNTLLTGANHIVGGSRYIGTVPVMPKNIPLRADGMPSKYIGINEPIELRNLVPCTKTKYTLTKKDGRIYKYMTDYNNYNLFLKNGQGSNWSISLKVLPDDIRNKIMNDDRTQYDQMYAQDNNTNQNSGYYGYGGNSVIMYPYPNYKEDIKIEIGDKLKISLVNHYFNTFYKNGNAFKGDPDDRSRIYKGYEDNALQTIVPEHEINFIDHLPYKFNYYLVENTVDSKIDGLLGYKVNEVVNENENSKAYDNMTRNHKRNTLSLFIDFSNDMKFLNPYELSQVVVPYKDGIKINNTSEFLSGSTTYFYYYNSIYYNLSLLNIFTDTSKMRTNDYESIIYDRIYDYIQSKERFNENGVYYKHYTFNTSLNTYGSGGDYYIDYYRNKFKDIKKYNGYGDLSPIMILKERNGTKSVWGEDYNAFADSYSSRKLYGNDAWLLKKNRYNYYYNYEWNYYDITGNYSSYLLGVFPVKDNDVIDYDNPIMYRHIIPDVAYKAILNREKNNNPTKYKILLNDVFDRKNTSTYEFNDSDSEEKLYNNTPPVSSFFHRNSKSSNLVNNDNFADPKGYIGISNKINNYANVQIPTDMGKIAIKLYHSIPLVNVPKVLRDYKYNAPVSIPFKDVKGNIENTIYNGQEIDTVNTRKPNATYKTNELITKYTPYLYDVTEDILNTKALIIDPNKATYDNLPLLRNDIRYKIVKVTENAIFITTEFECDDKYLDILYETAKCWVTLSDEINDTKIFPDSMEILPEYSIEDIFTRGDNCYYIKEYSDTKDIVEKYLAKNYKKVLKININLDLFNISETQNKVKDVLHKEDSKLYSITNNKTTNNEFYLDDMIYINFSMSNTLFNNEDILNYDNLYKDVDYKEYLGELDNQFMFRTITPKDEDKQKTSNLELRQYINTNKRFSTSGIYTNAKDYIKDGTSEIIYSIGLTPLTLTKLLYKDRNYITKTNTTLIKPFFNGLPLSCPPLVRKSEYSKDIPKDKVISDEEFGRIRNNLSSFPFNIDEMTMDEVENLFDIITTKREEELHSTMLGYTTDEVDYYSKSIIYIRNRNTNTKENKNHYMKNIERNSNNTQTSKENAKIYSFVDNIFNNNNSTGSVIFMFLFYYYMIQPKVLFYNTTKRKDSNDINFLTFVENEEDRLKRLDEFFKEARGEENLYNFTRDYKDYYSVVPISKNKNNLSFNKTWYTGRYENYAYDSNNWKKDVLSIFSNIQHTNTNGIKQELLNFYKKFNSDWLFIYTPGLNKEKDKYISKILYSYIPAIIYFIRNEILKYSNSSYDNGTSTLMYNVNFDKIFMYFRNSFNNYNEGNMVQYFNDSSIFYGVLENIFKKTIDDEEYKELYSITNNRQDESIKTSVNSPLRKYKDIQMSLINTKELLSYETFRKSDINNKFVDNILMGKTAEFVKDIKQFPQDAKAVVVNIPINKCHNNNIHNTFSNTISNAVNLLKEYNKINKSIIVIIECVTNNSNNISINYDKPNMVEDNSTGHFINMLKRISGYIKNYVNNTNLVIDGLYFKFNNFLMSPMCIKNISDTNNVQFVYKLNNMEKALLKKNMVLGINYMEFPNTLEEFKDVMDNNYNDIINLLKNGTVKYYKLGEYAIPEEYNDRLEKIKALIGYRVALHNMYKIIDQNSRENIFQNSRSSFYLDIVSLSRCGIYDNHYKRKNVDYFIYENMQYFSNIDTRLKLSIEIESKYRYDNTSIIKTLIDKNTFTNTVNSNVIENRIVNDIECKYIRNNNTTDIWDSLNMNTFVDFTRISLQMRKLFTEVTLKNNHPLYLGTTSTYELRPVDYDPSQKLYSNKEEDGKKILGTAKFNAFNMSSFSSCNVFLNLRTTPTVNTNGQANTYGATLWGVDDSYIHLSNMNQEENNGVLINSFRTDAMFFDMPNN